MNIWTKMLSQNISNACNPNLVVMFSAIHLSLHIFYSEVLEHWSTVGE